MTNMCDALKLFLYIMLVNKNYNFSWTLSTDVYFGNTTGERTGADSGRTDHGIELLRKLA